MAATTADLVLNRVFDAPVELVFKAWTDPQHLARWWGPAGFTNPRCEFEARPGGRIHIDMRGPDGTTFPMTGTVAEIVPNKKLVMVCQAHFDQSGVPQLEVTNTAVFEDDHGRTRLTLTAVVVKATEAAAQALQGMTAGWTQTLQRLGGLVASTAVGVPTDHLEREIIESRTYLAPRDLVYRMFTEPEHLAKWWGPHGFSTVTDHLRPERLVYEHASPPPHEVTVIFTEVKGATRVYFRMVFPDATELAKTVNVFKADNGLGQTLDRLTQHLSTV
ncbi:MAG TPA: SRPBCC domain-containing protein [Candidatus Xenobia bacterium]|jgi:uncharacterized protein YndB with AHSA1/START domain